MYSVINLEYGIYNICIRFRGKVYLLVVVVFGVDKLIPRLLAVAVLSNVTLPCLKMLGTRSCPMH